MMRNKNTLHVFIVKSITLTANKLKKKKKGFFYDRKKLLINFLFIETPWFCFFLY